MKSRIEVNILIGIVTAAALATAAAMPAPLEETSRLEARSAELGRAPSDTLDLRVRRGGVLITDLPESLGGHEVESYSILRSPSLSWLVDFSFMWRTFPEDAGEHVILLRADRSTTPDTLVLAVTVE